MLGTLRLHGQEIGDGHPCFVIAEAGVNHDGRLERALELIDVAALAGADAVKFQTFSADRLVSAQAPKAIYQQRATDDQESQWTMLKRLELSPSDHHHLLAHCRRRNILFLSTPFDEQAAAFLNELPVPAFKIPSGELTNRAFLKEVACKQKPMILSTGMATLGEVEEAVSTIEATGNSQLVLLHCVSNYPADPGDVNLKAMLTLRQAFGYPVGYSDHTLGAEAPLAAVALGASVMEKHFTLDRTAPGPDHAASMEPDELGSLIRGIRTVEAALGNGRKRPVASEYEVAQVARKSLVARARIPAGALLTADLIAVKRPGSGLPPSMKPYLLNRTARVDIPAGTLLSLEMVS